MRSTMLAAVFLTLLVGGSTVGTEAGAQPPAMWSIARASLGADLKGAVISASGERTEAFLPGAYFSYSLASNLSLAATCERDFARKGTVAQAGARVRVLDTPRGDIAGGISLVSYSDAEYARIAKPTSVVYSVHGAWDAVRTKGRTNVWLIASAGYDPANDIKTLRAGLRLQLIGGAPVREPDVTQ